MKIPQGSVDQLRRMQEANMPDTCRVIGMTKTYLPGGASRPNVPTGDVATTPCRVSPLDPKNAVVAGQEIARSRYIVAMPLTLRGVIDKAHELEVTSAEFGWVKDFVVDEVAPFYTNEVCVKAYCSEA